MPLASSVKDPRDRRSPRWMEKLTTADQKIMQMFINSNMPTSKNNGAFLSLTCKYNIFDILNLNNLPANLMAQRLQHTEGMPPVSNLSKYLSSSIRVDWLIEVQLLLLTFSIGIQDAISFPDFHCFASNQTGNSVLLAVGLAGLGGNLLNMKTIGISLGSFVLGAIITGQSAHLLGPRRRYWLLLTHLIQTMMVFGASSLQAVNPTQESESLSLAAIMLLAFSSGAQVASMRPLRVQEITTAMATAAWVDLVIDPKLLSIKNHPRDRRVMFLLVLVLGSFTGAFAHRAIGSSNTLILSAAGKLLVTVSLLVNRSERESLTVSAV